MLGGAVPISERGRDIGERGRETARDADADEPAPAASLAASSGGDGTAEEAAVVAVVKEAVDAGIDSAEVDGAVEVLLCTGPSVAADGNELFEDAASALALRGMTDFGCMTGEWGRRAGGDSGGETIAMTRTVAEEPFFLRKSAAGAQCRWGSWAGKDESLGCLQGGVKGLCAVQIEMSQKAKDLNRTLSWSDWGMSAKLCLRAIIPASRAQPAIIHRLFWSVIVIHHRASSLSSSAYDSAPTGSSFLWARVDSAKSGAGQTKPTSLYLQTRRHQFEAPLTPPSIPNLLPDNTRHRMGCRNIIQWPG